MSLHEEYEKFVASRCKKGGDINLSVAERHILHMLLGLSGEVGELVDALKKSIIYNKVLDTNNVIEELGDIEFYLAGLRNGLRKAGYDIPDANMILARNMSKLTRRYPEGYTDQAAQARADKQAR